MLKTFDNFSKLLCTWFLFPYLLLFDVTIAVAVDGPSVLVLSRTGKNENSGHISEAIVLDYYN